MNSYTNYHIIRINTTIQEVFIKFTNPPLPDYFCKRGYDGELTEEKLQSIILPARLKLKLMQKLIKRLRLLLQQVGQEQ